MSKLQYCLFIFFILLWGEVLNAATTLPYYKIDVKFEAKERKLIGRVIVTFDTNHYPKNTLFFALPMNRFSDKDSRGPRKILQTPVFALDNYRRIKQDPLYPFGFSKGDIQIKGVYDSEQKPIKYSIQPNADIPVGYSRKNGLLVVYLDKPLSQSKLVINFITNLPERFYEGVVDDSLLVINWHPFLLPYKNGKWSTGFTDPSPAFFDINWEASESGTLITTNALLNYEKKQKSVFLPSKTKPLKYFPLIFSSHYRHYKHSSTVFDSFYFDPETIAPGAAELLGYRPGPMNRGLRKAGLLNGWAVDYFEFIRERYGLLIPWEKIRIVAIRGNHEQVRVFNNLVLVTIPHYKRTKILDRRVLGFFTRGLGKVWFGETVWNNQDKQLWLSRGLPAFLSLKYYEYKFGHDARLFDFIDWLNPSYKEHFYESMVRRIRPEFDVPIITSVQEFPETRILMRVVTYKTALVLSMLENHIGYPAFKRAIHSFYQNKKNQIAVLEDFQKSAETSYGKELKWFFWQWFYTTYFLDYAIEDLNYKNLSRDLYEVTVTIKRKGTAWMPYEVLLVTEKEQRYRKKGSGEDLFETITFYTESPPAKVSIDPEEQLLDSFRRDNHSFLYYRVRFAFDWKKDREVLITFYPTVESNALDGNIVGMAIRQVFDNYNIYASPGYGTKNDRLVYYAKLERRELGYKGLSGNISLSHKGGIDSRAIQFYYRSPRREEDLNYVISTDVSHESVFKTTNTISNENNILESGDSSNVTISYVGNIGFRNQYFLTLGLSTEKSLVGIDSDFDYSLFSAQLTQIYNFGDYRQAYWQWIYGTTNGTTPLQKKYQLGSPRVLRGYPQRTILRDDHILVSRLDYKYPLVLSKFWGDISSLGVRGSLFYDTGKVWSITQEPHEEPMRQNVGLGVEVSINAITLFQVPLKLEVAWPVNDNDFNQTQFVFFEALSFF